MAVHLLAPHEATEDPIKVSTIILVLSVEDLPG